MPRPLLDIVIALEKATTNPPAEGTPLVDRVKRLYKAILGTPVGSMGEMVAELEATVLGAQKSTEVSNSSAPQQEAAEKHGCAPSQITKWKKEAKNINRLAADSKVKKLTSAGDVKRRLSPKGLFWKAELAVVGLLRKRRAKGRKCTAAWVSVNMRAQVVRLYGAD